MVKGKYVITITSLQRVGENRIDLSFVYGPWNICTWLLIMTTSVFSFVHDPWPLSVRRGYLVHIFWSVRFIKSRKSWRNVFFVPVHESIRFFLNLTVFQLVYCVNYIVVSAIVCYCVNCIVVSAIVCYCVNCIVMSATVCLNVRACYRHHCVCSTDNISSRFSVNCGVSASGLCFLITGNC